MFVFLPGVHFYLQSELHQADLTDFSKPESKTTLFNSSHAIVQSALWKPDPLTESQSIRRDIYRNGIWNIFKGSSGAPRPAGRFPQWQFDAGTQMHPAKRLAYGLLIELLESTSLSNRYIPPLPI
jgi:hypothetical protein